MKNKFLKISLVVLAIGSFISCDEIVIDIPATTITLSEENFQSAVPNTDLDLVGWTNFNEVGTSKWKEKVFSGNGYAEFSAFGSTNAVNTAWLISPELNLNIAEKKGVAFQVAQHHLDVDSPDNSLEVFVSTNYDGTNVLAATWTPLVSKMPTKSTAQYLFLKNNIDLSAFSGKAHIAFKYKGSGTNATLDGAFQVDNFLFYKLNN